MFDKRILRAFDWQWFQISRVGICFGYRKLSLKCRLGYLLAHFLSRWRWLSKYCLTMNERIRRMKVWETFKQVNSKAGGMPVYFLDWPVPRGTKVEAK